MATDPNSLLAAASIFSQVDPRVRQMMLQRMGMAQPQPTPFMQAVPVPVPVPVQQPQRQPKQQGRSPNAGEIFGNWAAGPQAGNEPNLGYAVRHAMGSPFRAMNSAINDVSRAASELTSTPNSRQAAQPKQQAQGNNPFPTSYNDPIYDEADMNASRITGVPVALIHSIRVNGERSNNGQVSSAGAETPYQIIPSTRQGIIKNYGIDPLSNPMNAALGAAYVLREQAGKPGPQGWTPELMAKAAAGYNGGFAAGNNPFGPMTGSYVQRVLGPNTGLPAPFVNPYDPRFDKAAMGMIGAERQALMTPFSASMNIGPAPELPKPQDVPRTDFTQSDADLQAMRPEEMSLKEQRTRERDGFWQGIGKAMLSMSGNEGLGTFLMKMAGGALTGRYAARDEIRAEQDKFDEKMSQWEAAVYRNDYNKANIAQQEAAQQVANTNEYNMKNWTMAYDRWAKSGSLDISGTNAVMTRRDEKGNISIRTIPIAGAVDAAISQQAAQAFSSVGGRQLAGNQQVASMANAFIGRQAIASMTGGSGQEADGAAAAAPAFYGTFIASHGLIGDLLGPDAAKSLQDDVNKRLQGMQLMPGSKDWNEQSLKMMSTELAKLGLANPAMMQKMMQVGGSANSFTAMDRYYGRSERTSTNAKGEVSSSTTYDGNAADIFQ